MADNLLLLISNHDGDFVNSCLHQAFDLVVKDCLVVNPNQTLGAFAVDRANSRALPSR
jgi:hypothetical protein